MRVPIAELIARAGKTRQRELVLPAIVPPMGFERDLLRIYMQVVREWGRRVQADLMPVYEATLGELVRDAPADVRGSAESVADAMNRLVITLGPQLEDWVVRTEQWHRGRTGALFTPAGVSLGTLLGQGDVARTLESVLGENTALIRSLSDQMRNGISGAVFRGLTERKPAREVAAEIRKVVGIGRSRAELIAADQLQKLTGRLDQERQEQLGITEFEWQHSRKKNPREEHRVRDGKRYRWESPTGKDDPPGRAIRCGCRARAVVDLKAELKATGVEAVEPPAAPPTRRARQKPQPTADQRDREYVLANGRRDGVEHLTAYDARTGVALQPNKGTRNACALTPEMESAIADKTREIVFHHNHPSSSSLSAPDLDLFKFPGLKGIWAHGHNGSAFYAERGKLKGTPALYRAAQGAVYAKLNPLVANGLMTVPDANLLHNHISWLLMHQREQLVYRAELAGESAAAEERHRSIIDRILEALS